VHPCGVFVVLLLEVGEVLDPASDEGDARHEQASEQDRAEQSHLHESQHLLPQREHRD